MTYYQLHKQERLDYQTFYNIINNDKIKEYQRQYFQKNKEKLTEKRKQYIKPKKESYKRPSQFKLKKIEKVLQQKLDDYKNTLEQEKLAKLIVNIKETKPLEGIVVRKNQFVLEFT